ncbi:S9 family peptidase, partial [Thermoproteota archaeon]
KLVYKLTGFGFFHDSWRHLFVVNIENGETKQLTDGEFDVICASWSPNNDEIAFVANITKDADYTLIKDIWILSIKDGSIRKITNGNWQIDSAFWSPDGKKIAYIGREMKSEKFIVQKNPHIWVHRINEEKSINVTNSFNQWIVPFHPCENTIWRSRAWSEYPIWSSDSKYIYFKAHEKGALHIYRVNIDNHNIKRITNGLITVGSFNLGKNDSKIVFSASEALRLNEVWLYDGIKSIRLTDINNYLYNNTKLSSPEEFNFVTSDGFKIQGWILRPIQFRKEKKYPTILEIHGGPYGAYGYKFGATEHEIQVLAEHGFVVIYTNPRGSLGYGEVFSSAETGNWGERDYQDLMEAMDFALDKFPFIDRDKLGVTGGSYGGFMTNWIIGHTEMFKAAVTCRSIINWLSGASDIHAMQWINHDIGLGNDKWDDIDTYYNKSPIKYVNNINTPLLIIVSDEDHDTGPDQAEQLFVALKKRKKKVELIIFISLSCFSDSSVFTRDKNNIFLLS